MSEASGRKWLLLAKTRALDFDSLSTLVVAANRANVMRAAHSAALGTARQAGELQREVAATFALPGLGIAFLGQWGHGLSLPFNVCIRQ